MVFRCIYNLIYLATFHFSAEVTLKVTDATVNATLMEIHWSFGLKWSKKPRRFGCKLCDKVCDSIHELSIHHQQSHNILYYDVCTKAFNNPVSLAHHKFVHQEAKFQCEDCDQSFPFESTLKSHCVSHRTLATYFCSHANWSKKFKNKGDLTRHVKEHSGVLHECLDQILGT